LVESEIQASQPATAEKNDQLPIPPSKRGAEPEETLEEAPTIGDAEPIEIMEQNNTVSLKQLFLLNKDSTVKLADTDISIKYTGSWHRHTETGGRGYINLEVSQVSGMQEAPQHVPENKSITFSLTDKYRATVYKHSYDTSITAKIHL
jgi:hypothetical protein